MPAGAIPSGQPVSAARRQLFALLLAVASLTIVVAGVWDEFWHRLYGIPFGDDFFWRPHLLMYAGFGLITALGFFGLYTIMQRGRGTLAQRFHANPVLGLLALVGGFLMLALPADPIWHGIYGPDLSAWSLPHLVLLVTFCAVMVIAAAVHLSALPARTWATLRHANRADALPLVLFAMILLLGLQLLVTEWDGPRGMERLLQARPDWLLPALICGMAGLAGALAVYGLRRAGAATAAGLIAVAARWAMIQLLDAQMLRDSAWVVALPPLIAIDLWAVFSLRQKRTPPPVAGSGAAAALGMLLVAFPLMGSLYPDVVVSNVLALAVVLLLVGLGTAWAGAQLGDYLAAANKDAGEAPSGHAVPLAAAGAFAAAVAFIVVFIATAVPPV